MPREDRRIYFDYEESFKAIYQLCAQKNLAKPPPGVIVRVETDIENPLDAAFVIENLKTNEMQVVKYTKDFTVAALMIMCRTIGIPLPKRANKTLEIAQGKIVLRIQLLR